MVERTVSLGVAGADSALKETLQAQQELLQTLYTELDVEREASSSAASEALSMILRLQGEKAALTMEASQYKRMAEEKMCHAETSLALFEELIYQKEMEIASLEFQVQAYRCKLLSLGCSDPGVGENKFPENLMLQTNDALFGETGAGSNMVRRLQSLPPLQIDDSMDKKITVGSDKSLCPSPDIIPDKEVIDQTIDISKKSSDISPAGDLNSYWEQIKKLDERVREISDFKDARIDRNPMVKRDSRSRMLLSHVSTSILESTRDEIATNLEKVKNFERFSKSEAFDNPASSSNVYDIFEVPQAEKRNNSLAVEKKGRDKSAFKLEDRLGKPDLATDDIFEPHVKDDTESLKTVLLSTNNEKRLSFPKPPRDGASADRKRDLIHATINISEYQSELQQLNRRVQQLEGKRTTTRNEINEEGQDELNLLKEIREKLNSIQSEMRSWKMKEKTPPIDDSSLHLVQEAMLYFWL
ncbi:myosin-binding protein 7 [Carica papaya]|uniref:myosin-binding protein 7 n=1 Tax=Carica papaya TaxID=3649 RepID=UPI000B8C777E|nr:myosin-binding protein 7 [Carica papaya]